MANRNPLQTREENAIFAAFLQSYPSFAATVVDHWVPDDEFPDRAVKLRDGRVIDLELTQWIHPGQTAQAKSRERLADAIVSAIGAQGTNYSPHFRFVLLFPRSDFARFEKADEHIFHEEIWRLISQTNERWLSERHWHSPQGRQVREFNDYPIVGKYLRLIIFDPLPVAGFERECSPGVPWIDVSSPCSSYSPHTAIEALVAALNGKIRSYGGLASRPWLLVYYGSALMYNTPWYGIQFQVFSDVAKEASKEVASQSAFDRIYLLKALEPGLECYEIFPNLGRCE